MPLTAQPFVSCSNLTFAWPTGEVVLDHLTCSFPPGRTGLVGRNGSGKSTLLKIIAGELAPTSGSVTARGTVGYLPQDLVLDPVATVADLLGVDDVLAALGRIERAEAALEDFDTVADSWDIEERLVATLARVGFVDLDLSRRLGTLSGGETVLLALAAQLIARPDVLLLDEPTNNLDRDARGRLADAVAGWSGPVIVVSHDRDLLDRVDAVAELRDSTVRIFGGTFRAYTDALAVEQEAAARAVRTAEADLRRQQRELIETRTRLERGARYGRSQAEGMGKAAVNFFRNNAEKSGAKLRTAQSEEVERARGELEEAESRVREDDLIRVDLPATRVPDGRDVLVLDRAVLRTGTEVSAHVRGPERIALTGPNGVGKTTLVNAITGTEPPRAGRVDLRVPTRVLPQRLTVLDPDASVLAAVGRLAPSADDHTLRARLARFRLDADTVGRPVRGLSGGERFRATLAGLLLSEPAPQLLVLDEPTNNLDLDSVAQLGSALAGYRGALLVISHDERFLADLGVGARWRLEPGSDGSPARFSTSPA